MAEDDVGDIIPLLLPTDDDLLIPCDTQERYSSFAFKVKSRREMPLLTDSSLLETIWKDLYGTADNGTLLGEGGDDGVAK